MAQRDPLVEYQREGFQLFKAMTDAIKEESVGFLFNLQVQVEQSESGEDGEVEIEIEGLEEFEIVDEPEDDSDDDDATSGGVTVTAGAAFGARGSKKPAVSSRLVAKGLDEPRKATPLQYSAPGTDGDESSADGAAAPLTQGKIDGQTFPGTPRNATCPCGSGKKYKVCHGKNEVA